MLTEVKVYSSWNLAPALLLDEDGRAETDLIQVRNIDGLEPVNASVTTVPFGSIDGGAHVGSSVASRNIVLTLHPNPNWDAWTYENLRRLAYAYFMPKRSVKLVFYSDDIVPVEISGIVESIAPNIFSSDGEWLVSIICPDPYFTAVEPVIVTGESGDAPALIEYGGNIETGFYLKVTPSEDTPATAVEVQIGDPPLIYFGVYAAVNPTTYFEMNTLPMRKFVRNVNSGIITSLLSQIYRQDGALWPVLQPGENEFSVFTNAGVHNWELKYYEKFGGL